jgi:predicted transcriptional regulator
MQYDDLDMVFEALAHRDRRRILDVVRNDPGCCVEDVCRHFTTSRVAVLKHVRVLERAELLVSEKVGRQRKLYVNVVPIQIIHERWTTEFSALWAGKLTRLKYAVESTSRGAGAGEKKRHG